MSRYPIVYEILIPISKVGKAYPWQQRILKSIYVISLPGFPSCVFFGVLFNSYVLQFISIKCHITINGASFSKVKYSI